jgi:uncharacterized membrane protein
MKKTLIVRLRNYFLAGIFTLIPIFITVYFVIFIIELLAKLVPKSLNPNTYIPFNIPGLEILISLILITLIGLISVSYLGKKFLLIGEAILEKIPLLRTIYSGVNQLTKSFSGKDDSANTKKVVLVQFPRIGAWSVGFATNESKIKDLEGMINVFIPTTPNPTSGFLIIVPKKDLIYLNMSFENATKFIMSAGTIGGTTST